jgi:hypothetical protein
MRLRPAAPILLTVVALLAFGAGAGAEGKKVGAAKDTSSRPASAGETADGFLHSIYDRYIGPQTKAPPIDYANLSDLERYFDASLAAMIHDDFIRAQKADDVPSLDGDPFIDAQDWEVKSFDIRVTAVDADRAIASVKFTNAGTPEALKVQLVRVAGSWKIHDIDYGNRQGTLRGLFKSAGSTS